MAWHAVVCSFMALMWQLKCSTAIPVPADESTIQSISETSKVLSVFLMAAVLVSLVLTIMGCTCCPAHSAKGIGPNSRLPVSRVHHNNLAFTENMTEFAIFPPPSVSTITTTQITSCLHDDKVTFEPLPDIQLYNNGYLRNSLPPRPAQFISTLNKNNSFHDWFDDENSNFPRNHLQYLKEVGSGWFGHVVEGEAHSIISNQQKTLVVVKILKEDATPTEHIYFLHEVLPFRDLCHPNIIQLLGRCLDTEPFLIIMEYTTVDLKTYLIDQRRNSEFLHDRLTLQMGFNVVSGLQHMHEHGFIHADLAARNCRVSNDLTVKLGDYGISYQAFKDDYYLLNDIAVPLRWYSPESLSCLENAIEIREVTREANVWTFGVLLWELLEFGIQPYFELTDEEVLRKVLIEKTVRLDTPKSSCLYKQQIYSIMQLCWKPASDRPLIQEIFNLLNQLYKNGDFSSNLASFEAKWNSLKPCLPQDLNLQSDKMISMSFENDFISNSSLFKHSRNCNVPPYEEFLSSQNKNSSNNQRLDSLSPCSDTDGDFTMEISSNEISAQEISETLRDLDFILSDKKSLSNCNEFLASNNALLTSNDKYEQPTISSENIVQLDVDTQDDNSNIHTYLNSDNNISYLNNKFQNKVQEDNINGNFSNDMKCSENCDHVQECKIEQNKYDNINVTSSSGMNSLANNSRNPFLESNTVVINEKKDNQVSTTPEDNSFSIINSDDNKPVVNSLFSLNNLSGSVELENVKILSEEANIPSPHDILISQEVINEESSTIGVVDPDDKSTLNLVKAKLIDNINSNNQFKEESENYLYQDKQVLSPKVDNIKVLSNRLEKLSRENDRASYASESSLLKSGASQMTFENQNSGLNKHNSNSHDYSLENVITDKSVNNVNRIKTNAHDIYFDDEAKDLNSFKKADSGQLTFSEELILEKDDYSGARYNTDTDIHMENYISLRKIQEHLLNSQSSNERNVTTKQYVNEISSDIHMDNKFSNASKEEIDISKDHKLNEGQTFLEVNKRSFLAEFNDKQVIQQNKAKTSDTNKSEFDMHSCTNIEDDAQISNFTTSSKDLKDQTINKFESKELDQYLHDDDNHPSVSSSGATFKEHNTEVMSSFRKSSNDQFDYQDFQERTFDSRNNSVECRPQEAVNKDYMHFDSSNLRHFHAGYNKSNDNDINGNDDYNLVSNNNMFTGTNELSCHDKFRMNALHNESDIYNSCDLESPQESMKKDIVTVEDLETGHKASLSLSEAYQDPLDGEDDFLRVDIETNEAILLDSSESIIGFVPTRSIEQLQDCALAVGCAEESLLNRNEDFSETPDSYTSDITTQNYKSQSSASSSAICSGSVGTDDELSEPIKEQESTDLSNEPVDNVYAITESVDVMFYEAKPRCLSKNPDIENKEPLEYHEFYNNNIVEDDCSYTSSKDTSQSSTPEDVLPAYETSKVVNLLENGDLENEDKEQITFNHPVIIEGEEILAGQDIINVQTEEGEQNLNFATERIVELEDFALDDGVNNFLPKATSESEASSPCRSTYTPDFESDSDDTNSESGNSCSSTSGSFECVHKPGKNVADVDKVEDKDVELDNPEAGPVKIFSGTWDHLATPTRSAIKTPEKKTTQMKKSVSFHEEHPPLVFNYPPPSDSSDEEFEDGGFVWHVDYTSYADWELQVGDDDEIPEDIIEVDTPDPEDDELIPRYENIPVRPLHGSMLYTLTGFTEDDIDISDPKEPFPLNRNYANFDSDDGSWNSDLFHPYILRDSFSNTPSMATKAIDISTKQPSNLYEDPEFILDSKSSSPDNEMQNEWENICFDFPTDNLSSDDFSINYSENKYSFPSAAQKYLVDKSELKSIPDKHFTTDLTEYTDRSNNEILNDFGKDQGSSLTENKYSEDTQDIFVTDKLDTVDENKISETIEENLTETKEDCKFIANDLEHSSSKYLENSSIECNQNQETNSKNEIISSSEIILKPQILEANQQYDENIISSEDSSKDKAVPHKEILLKTQNQDFEDNSMPDEVIILEQQNGNPGKKECNDEDSYCSVSEKSNLTSFKSIPQDVLMLAETSENYSDETINLEAEAVITKEQNEYSNAEGVVEDCDPTFPETNMPDSEDISQKKTVQISTNSNVCNEVDNIQEDIVDPPISNCDYGSKGAFNHEYDDEKDLEVVDEVKLDRKSETINSLDSDASANEAQINIETIDYDDVLTTQKRKSTPIEVVKPRISQAPLIIVSEEKYSDQGVPHLEISSPWIEEESEEIPSPKENNFIISSDFKEDPFGDFFTEKEDPFEDFFDPLEEGVNKHIEAYNTVLSNIFEDFPQDDTGTVPLFLKSTKFEPNNDKKQSSAKAKRSTSLPIFLSKSEQPQHCTYFGSLPGFLSLMQSSTNSSQPLIISSEQISGTDLPKPQTSQSSNEIQEKPLRPEQQ